MLSHKSFTEVKKINQSMKGYDSIPIEWHGPDEYPASGQVVLIVMEYNDPLLHGSYQEINIGMYKDDTWKVIESRRSMYFPDIFTMTNPPERYYVDIALSKVIGWTVVPDNIECHYYYSLFHRINEHDMSYHESDGDKVWKTFANYDESNPIECNMVAMYIAYEYMRMILIQSGQDMNIPLMYIYAIGTQLNIITDRIVEIMHEYYLEGRHTRRLYIVHIDKDEDGTNKISYEECKENKNAVYPQ